MRSFNVVLFPRKREFGCKPSGLVIRCASALRGGAGHSRRTEALGGGLNFLYNGSRPDGVK